MVLEQLYIFSMFTINGLIIGAIFDLFRGIRKTFKCNNIITYIQDILFWILSGILIIIFMYLYTDGCIRSFIFVGLSIGIIFYLLTVSKYVFKIYVFLLKNIKYLLYWIFFPFRFVYKLLKCDNKVFKKLKKFKK